MMPRLLASALLLTMLFALMIGGLRLLPPDRVVTSFFGDCSMPCWNGIEAGVTSRSDALALLKSLGWVLQADCNAAVYDACADLTRADSHQEAFVYIEADQVAEIALFNPGFVVGDVWLAYGAPEIAGIAPDPSPMTLLNTSLWFERAQISTHIDLACPAPFGDLLQSPIDSLLVWLPGSAMDGTVRGTLADLRRTFHQVCGI